MESFIEWVKSHTPNEDPNIPINLTNCGYWHNNSCQYHIGWRLPCSVETENYCPARPNGKIAPLTHQIYE